MGISACVRRAVLARAEETAWQFIDPLGVVDKDAHLAEVSRLLSAQDPDIVRLGMADAWQWILEILLGEWARRSTSHVASQDREARAIVESARHLREVLDIPDGHGGYTRKARYKMTIPDLDRFILYRIQLREAHDREIEWATFARARMVQLGFSHVETVEDMESMEQAV